MGQRTILRLAFSILLLCSFPIVGLAAIESTFRSGSITLVNDPPLLLVVNPDSNSISIVDLLQPQLIAEVAVGANPQTVSVDASNGVAYVANRDSDTVSLVDLEAARLIRNLRVGDEPYGVVVSSSGRLYVSNGGAASLDIVDPTDLRTLTVIDVPEQPRGLALDADECHLYVAHFLSGEVSIIETATLELEAVISTGPDSNLAQNILVDNESGRAYLPHTRSNTVNPALLFDTTVFPVVSVLDLATSSHAFRERIFLDIADRPVSIPLDAALSSAGKLYILNAGSNDVSVIDAASGRGLANIRVGDNPRGLLLSEDENALYVNNTLSGTVSVIDPQVDKVVAEWETTQIPLAPDVLNGKILFNSSARGDLARDAWVSCATCHFDAEMDGRTWLFRDGPRNTPSLLGVGDTLPIHWSGDLDELADVESTIRIIQAGTGLAPGPSNCDPACDQAPPNQGRSKDLDDLAAYMRSLRFLRNPNLNPDGSLTDSAKRGRQVFESSLTGCTGCHPAPLYTDRLVHDVGTGGGLLERKGSHFDSPSLRGVYKTAPYLHDGRAATLLEVLTSQNPDDRHGVTSHLEPEELEDLVAFLRSLPFPQRNHLQPGSWRLPRRGGDR